MKIPYDTCVSCAWLSPCKLKCFNPHYALMSGGSTVLPCKATEYSIYTCVYYENKVSREKALPQVANSASC